MQLKKWISLLVTMVFLGGVLAGCGGGGGNASPPAPQPSIETKIPSDFRVDGDIEFISPGNFNFNTTLFFKFLNKRINKR